MNTKHRPASASGAPSGMFLDPGAEGPASLAALAAINGAMVCFFGGGGLVSSSLPSSSDITIAFFRFRLFEGFFTIGSLFSSLSMTIEFNICHIVEAQTTHAALAFGSVLNPLSISTFNGPHGQRLTGLVAKLGK